MRVELPNAELFALGAKHPAAKERGTLPAAGRAAASGARVLVLLLGIALVAALVAAAPAGAVNPAGKKIAFVRGGHIWTMASDGTGQTDLGVAGTAPALSLDGTKIAFVAGGDVWTMASDGSGAADRGVVGTKPSWSPDGTRIAFMDGASKVETMNASGAAVLSGVLQAGTSPAWSPDGKKLVYVNGAGNVATMAVDGTSPTDLGTSGATPTWSPDGTKILYATTPPGGAKSQIYFMNADGSGQTRVVADSFTDSAPVWSPDGTKIAFVSDREGPDRIFVMASDGTGATSLSGSNTDDTPSWGASLANSTAPGAPTGTVNDGQPLTAQNGTWAGTTPITYGYQWKRCSSGGTGCTAISGATAQTYTLASADVGATLRVTVTATNLDGYVAADSAVSSVITAVAPASTAVPTVSGSTLVGQTLTATTGTWRGTTPMTYAYQWQRCDASGSSCSSITGATSSTYVALTADVGSTLRVAVTASNSAGSGAAATSNATALVTTATPAISVTPTVSGTAAVGQILTATTGTWTGAVPLTYTYQWQRCNSSGASCANIAAATTSTYVVVAADVGSTLRMAVTATNSAGAATANSAVTAAVPLVTPVNATLPVVSGTPAVGSSLSATTGTWTGSTPITYTYQWQRCDALGITCANISGATLATYVPTTADAGSALTVVVKATNAAGSATASADATDAVPTAAASGTTPPTGSSAGKSASGGSAPVRSLAPIVVGVPTVGTVLSATKGVWTSASPLTYTYRWQRCAATGRSCVAIAGATKASYRVGAADAGHRLRVALTASNAAGKATAVSTTVMVAAATGSKTKARPSISGKTAVGVLLHVTWASRSGQTSAAGRYQWQRCSRTGAACSSISGATAATYRVVRADVGSRLRVEVVSGSGTVVSSPTAPVKA